jgi:FKBP-type peptidyl-prolyl cis-trans isomerase SlyD
MSEDALAVGKDMVVSLEYVLHLEDGEELDRSEAGEALEFLQGHEQIISGLERALYGLRVGDEKQVVIEPVAGYGAYDEENLEELPRTSFPADLELEPGVQLQLRDEESGEVYQAQVAEVRPDNVLLDFNHPLAGETLHFKVKVVGLRQATADELAHGHVHMHGESH